MQQRHGVRIVLLRDVQVAQAAAGSAAATLPLSPLKAHDSRVVHIEWQ